MRELHKIRCRFLSYSGIALILGLAFLFSVRPSGAGRREVTFTVGPAGDYMSISAALEAIPNDAFSVRIRIAPSLQAAERDAELMVPDAPSLERVTFEAALEAGAAQRVRVLSVWRIFANGVALVIGPGLEFPNASVFGGSLAADHSLATVLTTDLTIAGMVSNVYGGGLALTGGVSIVRGAASVKLETGGEVIWQLCGGGAAEGPDAYATIGDTDVSVSGRVAYAFAGGAARGGGRSEVVGVSRISLEAEGASSVALFGGGLAEGDGSAYRTADSAVSVAGRAAWVFGGDYAFGRGAAELTGMASVAILPGASVVELYAGSFATDEGSVASIAAAEIAGAERSAFYRPGSVSSKGGTAEDPEIVD